MTDGGAGYLERVRTALFVLAFVLTACAAAAPRAAPKAEPASSTTAPRKTKLFYELEGRAFPLPVVRGTVSGRPTWMLVDTGASSHVIAGWFAKKIGLKLNRLGDMATDHAGRSVVMSRVDAPKVAIDGWGDLADETMVVSDVPPIIEKLGIGAFISPQKLNETGDAVVLDLRAAEMRTASFKEAARPEIGVATLIGEGTRPCLDADSPVSGVAYMARATVGGREAWLLVDTGAERSDLLLGSGPGQALAPKSVPAKGQMYGASGKLTSRTVRRAAVTVGELDFVLDLDLIGGESDPHCPRDGVLSMDVLRKCVLVLGKKQMVARCVR